MTQSSILYVIHLPDSTAIGGAEMSAFNLLERLPSERYRPSALVLTGSEDNLFIRKLQDLGIPVLLGKEVRHIIDVGGIRSTISLLRQQAPDLIHIHNSFFRASPYLPLLAHLAGVSRVLVSERTNHPQQATLLGRSRKWLISHSINMTVAVSNAVKETLLTLYKYSPSRVRVIRNAVDVDTIAKRVAEIDITEVRNSLGIANDAALVGSTAILRPWKGTLYLVEAMPIILQSCPNAHLLLVGDGEQRPAIEEAIHNHGLSERVTLAGWHAEVVPFLAAMDVFVLPSLFEGLPRSVLEAMAAARPIVATDVDGTSEVITNHQTGILVPPANVAALAESIVQLLSNRELASTLSKKAQVTALANYGFDALVQAYLNIYGELIFD